MLLSWYDLLAFAIAAIVVLATIPLVKLIALQYGYVELPAARKVHRQPMVRLGGVSICAGTLLALLIVWMTGGFADGTTAIPEVGVVMLGGCGFFLIGLVDDLIGLPAIGRLCLQCGIATWVYSAGVQIEFLTVPGVGLVHLEWFSLPLTVIWLTGVVNAINWIDGLDGLASGVSGIAAIITFAICVFTGQPAAALIVAALAGSLVGFLYYNFNPAQIFMGDGGSYFIGFTLAGTSIIGLVKSATAIAILLPLLILAVPLLDMSAVIVSRLSSGRSPFLADQRHLHHRLLHAGLSQRLTVLMMYALTLWAGSLAVTLAGIPKGAVMLTIATSLLIYATWKAWRTVRHHQT
jgi:UDP-N-acetylmuramyl pentapeptide phosphotransferase/UDP-N-acetylglucosamine-1-phosphate transferase